MANDLPAGFSATPPQGDLPQGFSLTPPKAAPAQGDLPQGFSRFSPNQNAILAGKSPVRHVDSMAQSPAQQIPTYQILGSADRTQEPDTGYFAPERNALKLLKEDPAGFVGKLWDATKEEGKQIIAPLGVFGDVAKGKASMADPATQERVMGAAALTGMREAPGGLKGAIGTKPIEKPPVAPKATPKTTPVAPQRVEPTFGEAPKTEPSKTPLKAITTEPGKGVEPAQGPPTDKGPIPDVQGPLQSTTIKSGEIPKTHDAVRGYIDDLAKRFGLEKQVHTEVGSLPLGDRGRMSHARPMDWTDEDVTNAKIYQKSGINIFNAKPNTATLTIRISDRLKPEHALHTAAHEFGHVLQFTRLLQASAETKRDMLSEYAKFLLRQKGRTTGESFNAEIDSLAHAMSGAKGADAYDLESYMRYKSEFGEWFADNVRTFLTTNKEAVSIADKFFKGVADAWRFIYQRVTGRRDTAKEVEDFMLREGKFAPGKVDPIRVPTGSAGPRSTSGAKSPLPPPPPPPSARAVGAAGGAGGRQPPPPPLPAGGPTIGPGGQRPPPLPPTGQILQAMQAASPGGPRTTLRGAAQTLAQDIGNLFGSTAQPAAHRAMTGINQAVGLSSRASAQTAAALEAFRGVVRKADMQSKLNILDYIETRTVQQRQARGATNTVEINGRHVPTTGTPVGGLLDTFRDAMKQRQSALQAMSRHQKMTFWEDYAKHMWKDPSAARKFFATASGKEGSTKSLKKRSIATIADGIRAGLEPVTIDPIEIGVRYVESIDRYIGMRNYFDDARRIRDIKGFMPGKAPDGWTKLETTFQPKGSTPMEYYAPDDFARIWNNFTKQGIMDQSGQSLYKNWMAIKAANMATSFGFSGYHAFAMTRDAFYSDFAKAIGRGMHGDPRAIGSTVVAPLAPVRRTLQGRRGLAIYRGQLQGSPVEQQLVDILSRTGARFAGKGRVADEYRFSGSGSYFTSLRKGTLKAELISDMKTMRDNPLMGVPKTVFKNIGRGFETVMSPLFEYYIPRMKLGASMDTMSAWLKRNPTASMSEQLDAANRIATSIDNRFGEVNQNRMFMNPMLKQIMNGALMSFSWQKGFFSEFIGAPMDAFKYGRDSTKLQYTIAVALGAPMLNSVEQYFRTGQWPWQTNTTVRDMYFPRTGGTNPDGSPQRIVQPDDIRTIFGWAMHPLKETYNVLATPIHTGVDLAIGKQYSTTPAGKVKYGPISPKGASWPKWLEAYLQVVANSFEPFVIAQETASKGAKNAIGGIGTFLGQRPAGTEIANPQRQKQVDDWLKYGPQKRPHYGGTY